MAGRARLVPHSFYFLHCRPKLSLFLWTGEPWSTMQPPLCWGCHVLSMYILSCPSLMHCKCETVEEAAQWDSSSFKQIVPVPATGTACTLLAKEINRPQQ